MENSIPFKRPEQALRPVAEQMLELLFSAEISDDDLQLVAVTLVEIIAPDILSEAISWQVNALTQREE